MAKFPDKAKATAKAGLCPYSPAESSAQRHDRRFVVANSTKSLVILSNWAWRNGYVFEVKNDGEHFIVRTPAGDHPHFAQWWPRSAKLVIDCDWRHGIHCHDAGQLIAELNRLTAARSASPEDAT